MTPAEGFATQPPASAPRSLLIGVGNPQRGDDAVGARVAERVKLLHLPGWVAQKLSGEGAALVEAWGGFERVVIVDALRAARAPGSVIRIDADRERVPSGLFRYSSHAFGLAEAIEIARTLDRLPARLIVFGVEGVSYEWGAVLSAPVEQAIPRVVSAIEAIARSA